MAVRQPTPSIRTAEDYKAALRRVAELRSRGETAEHNRELAAVEGAIANYVAKPGEPDTRKGRPREDGADSM